MANKIKSRKTKNIESTVVTTNTEEKNVSVNSNVTVEDTVKVEKTHESNVKTIRELIKNSPEVYIFNGNTLSIIKLNIDSINNQDNVILQTNQALVIKLENEYTRAKFIDELLNVTYIIEVKGKQLIIRNPYMIRYLQLDHKIELA